MTTEINDKTHHCRQVRTDPWVQSPQITCSRIGLSHAELRILLDLRFSYLKFLPQELNPLMEKSEFFELQIWLLLITLSQKVALLIKNLTYSFIFLDLKSSPHPPEIGLLWTSDLAT